MAPPSRKRTARVEDDGDDQSQGYEEEAPRNTQRRQRRRTQANDESDQEPDASTQRDGDGDDDAALIRKLVRYALACEYSRQNIRRDGIREKVIGTTGKGRSFKAIFEGAQKELKQKFGMQMMELPTKEKVTLRERRDAAQKNASQVSSSAPNAYILVSILPTAYRTPEIIHPSKVPSAAQEAAYIGLYTLVVSLIYLSGGNIPEPKLERHLKRMNADINTPIESTTKVLARMAKDGYIVKTKEVIGGEEQTEWRVGPRGKVEVGPGGVKGLVEIVYGENKPDDLPKRIASSLKLENLKPADEEEDEEEEEEGRANGNRSNRRGRRARQDDDDED